MTAPASCCPARAACSPRQRHIDQRDSLQAIARRLARSGSQHADLILLDQALFARVDAVYRERDSSPDIEQQQRAKQTWREFKRGGADLIEAGRGALRAINEELSLLAWYPARTEE